MMEQFIVEKYKLNPADKNYPRMLRSLTGIETANPNHHDEMEHWLLDDCDDDNCGGHGGVE